MQKKGHTARVHRIGVICSAVGLLLASAALLLPAHASPGSQFQGVCVGTMTAGTCVLDEPEGQDPSTQGTVTYLRIGDVMTYTIIVTQGTISDVQICMQASGPFAQAANACAGSHGDHVAFTNTLNVYSVNLKDAGFDQTDPLYWTLHVVAGGRTLQVLVDTYNEAPTTTTTAPDTTTTTVAETTTTVPETTTTTVPETTTTTVPETTTTVPVTTTIPPTTTTVPETTTTVPPTTTTIPVTTTTQPEVTTTTVPETTTTTVPETTTTTVPETTTTTDPGVTTTTVPSTTTSVLGEQIENTTTTVGSQVLGETLARTGGPRAITGLTGLALILLGAVIIGLTRYEQPLYPEA